MSKSQINLCAQVSPQSPADAERGIVALLHLSSPPWRPISSKQLSDVIGVSLQSLANWRVRGTGPRPEERRRGQGNRTMYRPDVVMVWLSTLSSSNMAAWEFSHRWLLLAGLDTMNADKATVETFIKFADQHRYFVSKDRTAA